MRTHVLITYLVLLVVAFLILLFTLANPARAHESGVWTDAEGFSSHGTSRCGMGYVLAYTGEQTWQPYLYAAGHWHRTLGVMPTPSCMLFFKQLEKENTDGNDK